jgi:mercuric ion transport protein
MRRALLAGVGGVGASLLAALCCAGPLLFVFFGVGAGLASTFEPLRPLFTIVAVIALGIAFHAVYGPRGASSAAAGSSAPGAACAVPRSRTRDRILVWSAAMIAALLWSFPYWATLLI